MQRILGLDGLRGLAVLAVILTHLHVSLPKPFTGFMAVHVFFVLSGFLITMLLSSERQSTGSISLSGFWLRRALRILPLYALVLALTAFVQGTTNALGSWKPLTYAVTFTYNFIPRAEYASLLGHTWSLAVEEHFYLVWPLIVLSVGLAGFKKLPYICALLFALSALAGVLLEASSLQAIYFTERWTLTAGGSIAIGSMVALLIAEGSKLFAHRNVLLAGLALYLHPIVLGDIGIQGTSLMAFGAALIIGWVCCNQSSQLVRGLEWAPLRFVGLISYGLYMWQGFFLSTGPIRHSGQEWPLDPLYGVALLVVVAPLSYYCFERPIMRLRHKRQRDTDYCRVDRIIASSSS